MVGNKVFGLAGYIVVQAAGWVVHNYDWELSLGLWGCRVGMRCEGRLLGEF